VPGGPAETVAPEDEPAHRLLVADDADSAVPGGGVRSVRGDRAPRHADPDSTRWQVQCAGSGHPGLVSHDMPE